jgi:hypothetical protein
MNTLLRHAWTFTWLVATLSIKIQAKQTEQLDSLRSVDPLIGSKNGGNVFAGATLPYGMAKGQPPDFNISGHLLKPCQPLRMWMVRILEDSPRTAATSLASQPCMTPEREGTQA